MTSQGYFSVIDHTGERSAVSFIAGDITAVSLAGFIPQYRALAAAIDGITLGTLVEEGHYLWRNRLANVRPADQNAQRERKWLVTYEDTTEFFDAPVNAIPNAGYRKVFNLEIPTADIAGRLIEGTERADLTNAGIAAFVSAFEAVARSPYGGSVNVLSVEHIGRNL